VTDVLESSRSSRLKDPAMTDVLPSPRPSRLKEPAKTDVLEPPRSSCLKEPAKTDVLEALSPVELEIEPALIDFGEVEDWEGCVTSESLGARQGEGRVERQGALHRTLVGG
jgi:hypothetical protein